MFSILFDYGTLRTLPNRPSTIMRVANKQRRLLQYLLDPLSSPPTAAYYLEDPTMSSSAPYYLTSKIGRRRNELEVLTSDIGNLRLDDNRKQELPRRRLQQ